MDCVNSGQTRKSAVRFRLQLRSGVSAPLRSLSVPIPDMKLSAHTTFSTGLDAEHFLRAVAVASHRIASQSDIAIDMLKRALLSAPFRFRAYNSPHALKGPCPPVAMALRCAGVGWGFYLLDRNLRHMSPDYFGRRLSQGRRRRRVEK